MRYQTIAECVEPGCKCDDRRGVILYDGSDRQEADDAKRQAQTGYAVYVDEQNHAPEKIEWMGPTDLA